MRKLAYIAEVSSVEPIEGADRLEQVMLKGHGWKIVTAKGDFSVGDLGVMFEIDSYLPIEDERYAFLKERCLKRFVSKSGNVLREGIRIKTCKLRGVVSQGLLMPLSAFVGKEILVENNLAEPKDVVAEDGKPVTKEELDGVYISTLYYLKDITEEGGAPTIQKVDVGVGSDLTELLHVEHYDEVKEQLQPQTGSAISGDAMGRFPSDFIPKTDEERIQNLGDWFGSMKGRKWQVSCKHDGTSCTIAYSPKIDFEEPAIVCSRNLRLKRATASGTVPIYWQMALKYNILGKLAEALVGGMEYAIQGEIVGPGINGDRNRETETTFKCFRIYDIANQKFLNPNETVAFCKEFDIPHVDIIATDFPFFDEITTMDDALKFAEGKTKEGNEREGVVCKTCDDGQYASFKIVSNKYLMKQKD